MGGEGREGKGRALMLLPLLLFFCVIRLALFVLLTPLAKEFLLTMYIYCIWCFFCCLSLLICSFCFFLDPYLLFLDLLAQCSPVRGLPDFVARLPSAFSFLRCC